MEINPAIFKAYDIRGKYPGEINETAAYNIGRSFVGFLGIRTPKIAVGRDNRLSSPSIFKSFSQGLVDAGAQVVNLGLATSPLLYFAVAHYGLDGGINITASHNPPEFNGFKMVKSGSVPISETSGILEIKKMALAGSFGEKLKGKISQKDALKDYVDFNLQEVNLKALKPLKIVVDTANAVSGIVIPLIFKKTPFKIYHIFKKLDGSFPNHLPDPLVEENLQGLRAQVLVKKADLGIAFDGDGDRLFFIDEKGEIVKPDLITALVSQMILEEHPGAKILYDIRSGRIIKETVENLGGQAILGRVGHSFIKEKMRQENIFFAGELSAHYYLASNAFCEAPFFVAFKILEKMSKTGQSLSSLVFPFKKYFHSGEINFRVQDKAAKIKEIEGRYQIGEQSHLDGYRVDFSDWWFNVRPSNTENLLRLTMEANTQELLEEKKKELSALIQS
jgi:phosphomannomutase